MLKKALSHAGNIRFQRSAIKGDFKHKDNEERRETRMFWLETHLRPDRLQKWLWSRSNTLTCLQTFKTMSNNNGCFDSLSTFSQRQSLLKVSSMTFPSRLKSAPLFKSNSLSEHLCRNINFFIIHKGLPGIRFIFHHRFPLKSVSHFPRWRRLQNILQHINSAAVKHRLYYQSIQCSFFFKPWVLKQKVIMIVL